MKTRTTHRKITTRTTLSEIVNALYEDGYSALYNDVDVRDRARELKRAAKSGCLLWTAAHIVTTDGSAINVSADREAR